MQIKEPTWSKLAGDTNKAWIQESNSNKEMVIAQFVAESKSDPPITKNLQMCTVYAVDLINDGYNTDYTANTQNSEGTYGLPSEFNANSAVYDATNNINSNEEIIEESQ